MKPTRDELFVEKKHKIIGNQHKLIAQLEKRVEEFEEWPNSNFKYRSKSSDAVQKKNKERPRGGAVKDHPGSFSGLG